MDPIKHLERLSQTYPLPGGYRLQDSLIDRLQLGALDLGMIGLMASSPHGYEEAIGAAGGLGPAPVERAYFELLERVCTLIARGTAAGELNEIDLYGRVIGTIERALVFPQEVSSPPGTPSSSNGVALHRDHPQACRAALSELIERDGLLRAWYGWSDIAPVPLPSSPFLRWARPHYAVSACRFDPATPRSAHSVAILARPRDPKAAPLLFASGGGATLTDALRQAEQEMLQRLCFLWGEDIPESAPQFSASVDYHQAYYLVPEHHALLERFCRVGHTQLSRCCSARPALDPCRVRFADLTPPALAGGLKVVRAFCPDALPVLFGHDRLATCLPASLQVHPIS